MGIGLLPRLSQQLTQGAIREWADQLTSRLEYLFQSPRQIGLVELLQFPVVHAVPGRITIPAAEGGLHGTVIQWGSGTVTSPATSQAVTFPSAFPQAVFVAFAIGASTNKFAYSVDSLTASGFTAEVANGGTTDPFYWIAVGH